jgi:bacteriocin biosynthesis cyclodehydratase domain-containing protein
MDPIPSRAQSSVPLPRALRLPPHHSLLRRGPTSRQFGLDPRAALAVDDLSPPLALMLDELVAPADRADLVARAVRRGADAAVAEELLRRLVAAGALVDAAGVERVARRRQEASVAVVGDGPLAVGVAAGLALAGVGAVHVGGPTAALVRTRDLGTGLLDADRGRPRSDALLDVVRRVAPGARAGPAPARTPPDLCVLADAAAPDPARVAELQLARVAHLVVRLRDGTGVVGPLVLPGRSACVGCVELHRRARDPGWPAVAAALLDVEGSGEPATAAATAALAVAQVLAALDAAAAVSSSGPGTGPVPAALGASLELDLAGGALRRRPWTGHPDCTCGAPPAQTCGAPDGRGTIEE